MDVSSRPSHRGSGYFGGGGAVSSRASATVALNRRELIDAIREYAARRGCDLPRGDDKLEAVCGKISLTVTHDQDDWQPLNYTDDDF